MAAYSHLNRSYSKNSGSTTTRQSLPTGCCNFRDLSNSTSAPKCGCTRFWLNSQQHGGAREWCFCGHHACFHESFSQLPTDSQIFEQSLPAVDQSYQRNVRHEPPTRQLSNAPSTKPQPTGLGIRQSSQQRPGPSQSINTRVWDALTAFAREQEDGAPSVISSKLPSTRTPSIADDTTIMHINRPICPTVEIPAHTSAPVQMGAEQYSATEVATPSVAGTPDLRMANVVNTQYRESPSNIRPSNLISGRHPSQPRSIERPPFASQLLAANPVQQISSPPAGQSSFDIQEFVRSYSRRLEVLENMSFSQVPAEEVHEKFEYFEGRLLELEHWKADQDQRETPPASRRSPEHRVEPPQPLSAIETGSFSSDASFDSNAAAYTEAAVLATLAANSETVPRIEALESKVMELEQASLPSFARPWKLQVVVLPWGKDLRGIWFSSAESTQNSQKLATPVEHEWQPNLIGTRTSFSSSTDAAWTTESIEAWANETEDWLSPKACGPHGTVFQRLASRGLVQELMLTGSDAHHILATIRDAFEDVLWPDGFTASNPRSPYHGLRQPFVPLRKIRKSTRLRFLSQAEMVTPAAWSASFLDSSIVMRVSEGVRRLYVTTSDAYLQAEHEEWSWKRIRDLPLYDATGDEMAAQAQGVAIESCWSYQPRLDVPRSSRSSFAASTSPWVNHHYGQAIDNEAIEEDHSPPSPHSNVLYTHRRTTSLETFETSSPVLAAKRRVASLESSQVRPHESQGHQVLVKKRRITASPEAERRGVGLTPRWSREPPSPYASENTADQRRRATTPFAYATPHSNNLGTMDLARGDGDTEADTEDLDMAHSVHGEDEWQGVDEDTGVSPYAPGASTSNGTASIRTQDFSPWRRKRG